MFLCLLLLTANVVFGIKKCDDLVVIPNGEVKELPNPSFPLKDAPFQNCMWSVVADVDRRIVFVCPFNFWADSRTINRDVCGAEMTVWDAGGNTTVYCRDKFFTRVGNSNRMFIKYKNDDDKFYNRTGGFKCYLYASIAPLEKPVDLNNLGVYIEPLKTCDFVIEMTKYDIVRLAKSNYTEDGEKVRNCLWTALAPEGSRIGITCPYTERPPHPVLVQPEPCTSQFTVVLSQFHQIYECSDRSFSHIDNDNMLMVKELSIKGPSRPFECYIYSESPHEKTVKDIQEEPIPTCADVIVLNGTTSFIHSEHASPPVGPGAFCRWIVLAPENSQISLNCSFTNQEFILKMDQPCPAKFTVNLPGGTAYHCLEKGLSFNAVYRTMMMILTYKNMADTFIEPFHCNISYAPLEKCLNCTDIGTENTKTYRLIKLKNREIVHLLSPNYPDKENPGSVTEWTLVADVGRQVVLVCPFYHSIEKVYKILEDQPCNGKFTVSPDKGEESSHCQDRGFARVAVNNVMILKYKNQGTEPLDPFVCYAYSEWDYQWMPRATDVGDPRHYNYNIVLDGINTTTLIPPSGIEGEVRMWKSRWNITALYGGAITLACHYTNKPPAPLTIQVVPCFGEFTVETKQGSKTHHCNEKAFTHTVKNSWVVLTYESEDIRPVPNFVCVAYSSNGTSSYQATSPAYENADCDYLIYLHRHEPLKFDSTNYKPKTKDSSRATCRWTFLAPMNNRIAISCSPPADEGTIFREPTRCDGQLTVVAEDRTKTLHCSEKAFSRSSDRNKLVLIYENEFSQSMEPFGCEIYAMENVQENLALPRSSCNYSIHLNTTRNSIQSPNYPWNEDGKSSCTWTVVAPPERRITLSCPALEHQNVTDVYLGSCFGVAYFTVSSEGEQNVTKYCHRSAFVHTSFNNKMKVVYHNPSEAHSESFKCHLRLVSALPWNECDTCNASVASSLPYKNCDNLFNLTYHSMTDLKLPENYSRGTSCRWTVVSPPDSRILLSCPQNDIKPETNDACGSYYTLSTAGGVTTYCRGDILNQPSPSNWSILTYENPTRDTVKRFLCFAYVEKQLSSEACINCKGLKKLDFSKFDLNIHLKKAVDMGILETRYYPGDLQQGVPYRWTVHSPPKTTISLTCDNGMLEGATSDDSNQCRGLITVYLPGKDPQYMCRHLSFGAAAAGNKMVITYGNQFGLTTKGFKCHIRSLKSNCNYDYPLGHLQYNKFVKIFAMAWGPAVRKPPTHCFHSFKSPSDTRIYLICAGRNRNESMAVSSGPDTADAPIHRLDETFQITSVSNTMTLLHIMDETSQPASDTGCRLYVDRAEALPSECNCGNKYNKLDTPPLPLRETELHRSEMTWSHATTFPMLAAIVNNRYFNVYCVATIISNYHAISSAQCYENLNSMIPAISIVVGSHKTAADGKSSMRQIAMFYKHPDYDSEDSSGLHDIAITFVNEKIVYTEYVQPACLPFHDSRRTMVKEPITFLGWKKYKVDEYVGFDAILTLLNSDFMLKQEGKVSGLLACTKAFGRYSEKPTCVEYQNKELSECQDDRGGPIFWKDPDTGLLKLVGIDIQRSGCGNNSELYYAKIIPVVDYVDWIQERLFSSHMDSYGSVPSVANVSLCTAE